MKREEARKKAHELVACMTLEEKASQLRYNAPAIERLQVPAYQWWNEGLHGVARAGTATMFPQAIGMAASFDDALLKKVAEVIATEGRAIYNAYSKRNIRSYNYRGLTFWTPNINIFRDPRWGRGQETYGEDPYLTTRMGLAMVRGLQGDGETMKTAACAKHFVAHSGPENVRHEFDAQVSAKDLEETYMPAFEALVKEGKVESVMGAYNRVNGEVACGMPMIQEVLRDKWGFEGHFVSDCWAIRDFHEHHMVTVTAAESAAKAINAGCDLNCGNTYLHILNAYEQGLVREETITTACERLFTTRYMLGIMEGSEYDEIPYEVVECREHLELSREMAQESMVLLKNDGILPLDLTKYKTIGVIGPNADSRAALWGNYFGTSSENITILQGIKETVGDKARVLYAEGCPVGEGKAANNARKRYSMSEASVVADASDVIVLCMGLDYNYEGEQGDTGNSDAAGDNPLLQLPELQREVQQLVAESGKPVIYCMMTGSAVDMRFAKEHFQAIFQLWYPGAEGGRAFADLLFGKVSPSGKLPITLYASVEGLPKFTDYSMKGRTYRYIETEPLYPFGFGLTYGKAGVTKAAYEAGTVFATVVNAGERATEDVVQVYIKGQHSPNATLHPSLCAFERVSLKPGEEKTICLPIAEKAFTVVDETGRRFVETDTFDIYVGMSSADKNCVISIKR